MTRQTWLAIAGSVAVASLPFGCSTTESTARSDAGSTGSPDGSAVSDSSLPVDSSLDGADLDVAVLDGASDGDSSTFPETSVFAVDSTTLAALELNGDLIDSSGNGLGGLFAGLADAGADAAAPSFVPSPFGQGLALPGGLNQGINWSAHASLLVAPYTLELVFTPTNVSDYRRLFAFDLAGNDDKGPYVEDGAFVAYPHAPLHSDAGALFVNGQRSYVAIVVKATDAAEDEGDIFVDGNFVGTTPIGFKSPPSQAFFFEDNANDESMAGVVEAIRISSGGRSPSEIGVVQTRLQSRSVNTDGG